MSKKKFNPSEWVSDKTKQIPQSQESLQSLCTNSDIEEITRRIESSSVDIAPNYADWRDLGFALADALGESGRSYFHRLSKFYPSYNQSETDKQFDNCLKAHGHGITIKTLFHLAKQAGIEISNLQIAKLPNCQNGDLAILAKSERIILQNSDKIKHDSDPSSFSEELETTSLPVFPDDIYSLLPDFLQQITRNAISPEDADLLLLGSLVVLSACMPNVYGIYGGVTVYPNLFLFVSAQASAGKGRLTLCRHLVEPIHHRLRESYKIEMEEYRRKQAEYVANKKNPDAEQPQEPPLRTLFIPANSSATSVYQVLNDNKGVGLMFETEGDTLANTFKSDYGNFSDGFRKAFHHETISYNRRKDREFVELQSPRLSAVLSGTPRQILTLIPDAENGLFSRFIFYFMNVRLVWNNVFANDGADTLDSTFCRIGEQFYDLYKILQTSPPIRFCFSKPRQDEFNAFFDDVQKQYAALFGLDIVASVRRLGLITYRIAMILTTLRIYDDGNISTTMVCNDADFRTALAMVNVLLQHTAKVFQTLPQQNPQPASAPEPELLRRQFLDQLPPEFNRQTYLAVAQKLGIPPKTAENHIKRLSSQNLIIHYAHDKYKKP
ncbi:DNA primase [Dysgonamonadaceae bacterium]|nr:DNA primase [Dysgonamonadaceae bacterium]